MSKHVPRKARWAQVNAKEFRSQFGVVRYLAGAWEGTVLYELRESLEADRVHWSSQCATAGRFKRPRNAMMAVEEKARALSRQLRDDARIAFAD